MIGCIPRKTATRYHQNVLFQQQFFGKHRVRMFFDIRRVDFGEHVETAVIFDIRNTIQGIQCVKRSLTLFANDGFIQLKPNNNMYKSSCNICAAYGFTPQPIISVDQLMTAYNMAGAGMGPTFTTDTVIQSAARYENLLFYKLDSAKATRILYIAHKNKKYISPAADTFVKTARLIYNAEHIL